MIGKLHYVSIKPNYFTTYVRTEVARELNQSSRDRNPQPLDNKSHGIMSEKANKRVRLGIDWLIEISKEKTLQKKGFNTNFKYKLNFITLTLSSKQIHSDNEIKSRLLNQFLTELRDKYACTNYLWRSEAQRNGNIHFHLVTDVFVPWRTLRTDWNRIQEKLGYISRFTEKTGKVDPNSTDVHSINAIKNLSAYLSKYCSKNSKGYVVMATKASTEPFKPKSFLTYKHPELKEKATFFRQVHGKLWGLSQQLSKLKSASREIYGVLEQEIEWLKNKKSEKVKYVDMAAIFMFKISDLIKMKCNTLVELFNSYKESVLNPIPILQSIPIPILNIVETKRPAKAFQGVITFE